VENRFKTLTGKVGSTDSAPRTPIYFFIWLLLATEMFFLLLPRTVLDLRAINFFLTLKDQPTSAGLNFGIAIIVVMMLIEVYSLFALWWLALRCTTRTIKEVPVYIGIGVALSVVAMLNFVLPIIWALVAIPLFSTAGIMGKLQLASLIVVATTFAVMYWRGKWVQANNQRGLPSQAADLNTAKSKPKRSKKWKFGLVFALIIAAGSFVLITSKPQVPLTLEEAMKLRFRASVQGAAFDIPVNYHHTQYSYFKEWPRPTQGELDKEERRKVDVIKVTALLPEMSPYTLENAAEFEKPGWGKTISIYFSQEKYLNLPGYISRLVKMENSSLPGMDQYESSIGRDDLFFSSDQLIKIRCDIEPSKEGWYPTCEVLRPYHYKQKNNGTAIPVFHLRYTFSRDYRQQWREIDEKVVTLFDRFAEYSHLPDN